MNNRQEVDTLLKMYDHYKELTETQAATSLKFAKAKITGNVSSELSEEYELIKNNIQQLSDDMTFANPIIWMMYKFEAYAHEAQPIRTMSDFRVHCSKEGYICTKRFTFLNEQLEKQGVKTLQDANAYPDSQLLSEVTTLPEIVKTSTTTDFKELWDRYEFYQENGKAAKWMNYSPGK